MVLYQYVTNRQLIKKINTFKKSAKFMIYEMKHKTQSAIIGRAGKRDEFGNGPVFIHLFSKNDPHKSDAVPDKFIDFEGIHKIVFENLTLSYLLAGSDILVNDLEYLEVKEDLVSKGNLIISGKHC